jgi:epoxyqueuosine reductase
MDKEKNYLSLKEFCEDKGADLFGIADISGIKKDFVLSKGLIEKFDKAICLGVRLSETILSELQSIPTKLYFHHYKMVNASLDQLAFEAFRYIQKKDYLALPIPVSQVVDWKNLTAHLSHRQVGELAGLGWIGRNNLLVNKELGSMFRLVSILTDMPLKIDKPVKFGCGECRLCIQVCPAKAIGDDAQSFDRNKCFKKLKEFHDQHLVDQYICGVCVNACRGKKR